MPTATRIKQPVGTKGSLKWIQRLANRHPELFAARVQHALSKPSSWQIEWVSPLANDERAEYRDAGFLKRLKLDHLAPALKSFWPAGGPVWDGLALIPGGVMLIEAKAHAGELASTCTAGAASKERIRKQLDATKRWAGAEESADWMNGFYQYANRLAHLRFLREQGIEAHLVFLYFCGDSEMPAFPRTQADWEDPLHIAYEHLGLARTPAGVTNVFVDVKDLTSEL